jgi:hypothetical protein
MTGAPTAAAAPAEAVPVDELSKLPPILKTALGADDPALNSLRLYPSPTKQFGPFLAILGTTAEEIGVDPAIGELTEASLTTLLRKSNIPIVQIDITTATPVIIARQLARDSERGYAVFIIRTTGPSLLVRDPENPEILQKAELPEVLKTIIQTSKKIFKARA